MARNKVYTDEHINYLRRIAPGKYSDEITILFNQKFGMNISKSALRTLLKRYGIRLEVPKRKKEYTDEQIAYLKELSAQGLFNAEITRRFNEKFGTNKTEYAIENMRFKYGFKTSARYYFKKNHIPWNKGIKGLSIGGVETRFKKGHRPHNWVPIGTERINSDGYVEVKVQDGKRQKNWKGKHILIWEQHHGRPVPPGYAVIFGDGNNRNFDPDNLILVSRKQLAVLNKRRLIQKDTELTKTAIMIANLAMKISERKKEVKSAL